MAHKILDRWIREGWAVEREESDGYGTTAIILSRSQIQVGVVLLGQMLSPDDIRATFKVANVPIMFIVADNLIKDMAFEPKEYLLVLHALYYGRVYAYRADGSLWGVHFERDEWDADVRIPDWKRVEVSRNWDFLDTEVDCLLPWYPGRFRIARPYDKAWWVKKEEPKQEKTRQQSDWGQYHHPQARDPWEVLGVSVYATKSDIKAAYRKLAREWHPDINKSPDATVRMQEINAAYEKLQAWVTA